MVLSKGQRSREDLLMWLQEHCLSLAEAGQLFGVFPATIHRWKSGTSPVPRSVSLLCAVTKTAEQWTILQELAQFVPIHRGWPKGKPRP